MTRTDLPPLCGPRFQSAQLVKLDGPPPDDAGVDVGSESKEAVLTIDMALKQDINMRVGPANPVRAFVFSPA